MQQIGEYLENGYKVRVFQAAYAFGSVKGALTGIFPAGGVIQRKFSVHKKKTTSRIIEKPVPELRF